MKQRNAQRGNAVERSRRISLSRVLRWYAVEETDLFQFADVANLFLTSFGPNDVSLPVFKRSKTKRTEETVQCLVRSDPLDRSRNKY